MTKFTLVLIFFSAFSSHAQDLDSLINLSAFTEESELQKQLNTATSVASSKALSTRETPGILSVITNEEIQNSGARDMIDVLRLVPGFDILQDNQFVMGLGIRGNWSNEGKVLVLMDGHYMNELLYQTVQVGNHFPVDAIERIEIIRGPGSAIYGGSAEYGVINIVTKAASSLNGVQVYGVGGFHSNAVGRTNAGVMAAQHNEKFSWDLSLFKGKGIVSNSKNFQDLYQSYDVQNLSKTTTANPMNINFGLKAGGLSLRTMYDEFKTTDPFAFSYSKNFFSDLRYDLKVNKKLTITPSFRYYRQLPWSFGSKDPFEYAMKSRAERAWGQVEGSYDLNRKVNFNVGALYFTDKGTDLLEGGQFNGDNTLKLNNFAFFAQGLFKHRLANTTVGFRYEKNNRYGSAFVPRLALTKKIENFHVKILYSKAFRAPSILNISEALTGEIKPEKTDAFEMELGYQFTPEMLLSLNTFSLTTKNVIIYGSSGEGDTFNEWYENYLKSGSKGLELVYSIRKSKWYTTLSYSYSQPISGNTVDKYEVPQTSKQYLGFSRSKIAFNSSFKLNDHLSINPSVVYGSKRYAYTSLDEDGNPQANELKGYVLANLFLNYKNLFTEGLNIGIGAYDLFNEQPVVPQAYNGDYAPIPGRSREYILKLSYQVNFKK
ncbi:MAG TPA: TonB-dependent receptor plug domain-containing protein [Cyclobacteriaceae bacterium]